MRKTREVSVSLSVYECWLCVCVVCKHKVFLFAIIQAESQYAHVNEPEHVIKNIYILGAVRQNLIGDAGCEVTSNISYVITDTNFHLWFFASRLLLSAEQINAEMIFSDVASPPGMDKACLAPSFPLSQNKSQHTPTTDMLL